MAGLICQRVAVFLGAALVIGGCGGDETTSSTSTTSVAPQVLGDWHGTLHQHGIDPFPVSVRIESLDDPGRNVVRYGGEIDCAGTWRFLGADEGTVRFRETIDSGSGGDCKGSGAVSVEPTGPNLRCEFSGGGVRSRGTLSPTG